MVGLQYLFLEPNADDPLNKGALPFSQMHEFVWPRLTEAAEELRKNREQFLLNVKTSMRGGHIKGISYNKVLVQWLLIDVLIVAFW